MQFKLLNFHKMFANIANNILGAFVCVIVLKETGSIFYAVAIQMFRVVVRFIVTNLLKNKMAKIPQLMILIRTIPILLSFIFLLLFSVNLWVGVIGYSISISVSTAIKNTTNDVMFNYSTKEQSSKNLGISKFFEYLGLIIATIAGGYLLDYIKQIYVVLIALIIYLISVVPLLIYYFKNKHKKNFNKELISNAALRFNEVEDKSYQGKKVSKKILRGYSLVYFIIGCNDVCGTIFKLWLFTQNKSFAIMGILNAVIYLFNGIFSYVVGKLDDKTNLTPLMIVSSIILGICQPIVLIINSMWVYIIVMILIGSTTPIILNYVYSRMISKCKILGISNKAIENKVNSCLIGNFCIYIPSLFGLFAASLIIAGAFVICNGYIIVANEEKTRKVLVNYLQDNEIES